MAQRADLRRRVECCVLLRCVRDVAEAALDWFADSGFRRQKKSWLDTRESRTASPQVDSWSPWDVSRHLMRWHSVNGRTTPVVNPDREHADQTLFLAPGRRPDAGRSVNGPVAGTLAPTAQQGGCGQALPSARRAGAKLCGKGTEARQQAIGTHERGHRSSRWGWKRRQRRKDERLHTTR